MNNVCFIFFNSNSLHIEIPQNQSAIQLVSLPRPLPLHPTWVTLHLTLVSVLACG